MDGVADDVFFTASSPSSEICFPTNYLQFNAPGALSPFGVSLAAPGLLQNAFLLLLPLIDCCLTCCCCPSPFLASSSASALQLLFSFFGYTACVEISFISLGSTSSWGLGLGLGFVFSVFGWHAISVSAQKLTDTGGLWKRKPKRTKPNM